MKRILFWGIAAVVGLSLISCENKEKFNVEEANEPEAQLFFASVEQPQDEAATKLFADSRLSIAWNASDMISLFNRYSFNSPCYFMGEDGDYSGFFKLYQMDGFVVGNDLENIYAVYPYNKSNRISNDEVLTVYLPDQQQYAEHSFGPECNLMVSATDDEELSFKNACGYLSIKLYGEERGIRGINLWGNNGERISGKAHVTMPVGGVPEVEMLGSENDQMIQLSVPYFTSYVKLGATAEEYTEFWFVLPPVCFERGFSIEVIGSNGDSFIKETTNPVTIERSMITRMAPLSVENDLSAIDYYTGPVTGDSEWSLVGALSQIVDNVSWASDWPAVQDGDIHVIANVRLAEGDEFKIRKNKAWDFNRGGFFSELGKGFECIEGGQNVKVGRDGIFDIYYNAALEQMAVCLPGEAPEWRVGEVGEAVDLGLSVKWASWNVGAYAPEEYGFYFAWGEVEPKMVYGWSTYQWCNGDYGKLIKYCPGDQAGYWDGTGTPDGKTVLDPEDDAAHVHWGGSWRMPTDAEWTELRVNCTWTWTMQNGVNGRLVTSNTNGNSIFLPAAGNRYDSDLYGVGSSGYYWSSSLNTDNPNNAWNVYFNSDNVYRSSYYRYNGLSVRPVIE